MYIYLDDTKQAGPFLRTFPNICKLEDAAHIMFRFVRLVPNSWVLRGESVVGKLQQKMLSSRC